MNPVNVGVDPDKWNPLQIAVNADADRQDFCSHGIGSLRSVCRTSKIY